MNAEHRINIRPAVLADAAALADLAARTYYETFAAVNTPENMQAYISTAFTVTQFESELRDALAAFYLAEVQGGLSGYAKLRSGETPDCVTGQSPVELVRLYVDQRWHGAGVAAALMQRCLTDAREHGFQTMYLGVWEHNLRAQAFYRKWGFVRVGEHVFQMGDDPQIDWWMAREI